jgi:hypothetical protein
MAGGSDPTYSKAVDVYDIRTGYATQLSTGLSVGRRYLAAAALDPLVMFAGGVTGTGSSSIVSDVIDIYNTATGAWTVGSLSSPRCRLVGLSLHTMMMFIGGNTRSEFDSSVELSDVMDVYRGGAESVWSVHTFTQALQDATGVAISPSDSDAFVVGGGEVRVNATAQRASDALITNTDPGWSHAVCVCGVHVYWSLYASS